MSIAKFCDKCCNKIDLCDTRNVTMSVKTTLSHITKFDLCPDCGDLFIKWLMNNEIKEDTDNKIEVGDEIISCLGNKVIITSMGGKDGDWCCIDDKGCTCQLTEKIIKRYNWHKTGKHFTQIVEMLEQIKEGE